MKAWARGGTILALGWWLLVVTTCLTIWIPMHPFQPAVIVPVVMYVGTSSGMPLWQAALLCFGLGYLQDFFCGSPVGLHTLIMTALLIVTRALGLWVFSRSWLIQILVSGVATFVAGILVLTLTVIFEPSELAWSLSLSRWMVWLLASSTASALIAPWIVIVVEYLDGLWVSVEDKA